MLQAVSLFSGAGGLDIGFERCGVKTVYAVEKDADSARTWIANRPGSSSVMHNADIYDVKDDIIKLQNIDIVFGGPPCQGFSIAGKMDEKDSRNKLVQTFLDIVIALRPTVFVMENVKALATHKKWEPVRKMIFQKTEAAGYDISMNVYKASDYGVPENRERLLLVGVQSARGKAFDFHNRLVDSKERPCSLRETLLSVGEYGSEQNPQTSVAKITIAKNPVIRGHAYSGMLVNGSGRPLNLSGFSPTLTASMGGNNTPIIDQNALYSASKKNWFEILYEKISSGMTASEIEVPVYVRRLTTKEASAIQTFPKIYKFKGKNCSVYRQIGNAVPCRFAEIAACVLLNTFFQNETNKGRSQDGKN